MVQNEILRIQGVDLARQVDRASDLRSRALKAGFDWLLRAVRRSYRTHVNRRRAYLAELELNRLDDQLLADIGIDRGDIPKVAHGLVDRRTSH
jgi:uncharacterized protein YjiS (DUF1127 family)